MKKKNDLIQNSNYTALIADLKDKIRTAQVKAALSVNAQLIQLYWDIGKMITEKQQESDWGDGVIGQIAQDLSGEFKTMQGFSRRNLYRIKQWYGFYADYGGIVPQAVAQIPWGHNALIISKIKDQKKALWYAQKTVENGWSRNALGFHIDNQLYERQETAPKIDNFSERLPAPQSDLFRQTLKSPYIFDFLGIGEEAHEREIEKALVDHITTFMLELGKGFAFVGKQYHIEVGGQDFYIDLLFYHLKLHCYIAIELKNTPFKPEYAGKINFYLTALDEQVKTKEDNPSIGLILCKDKNTVIAEYALRGMSQPMGVSEYKLTQAVPDELKTSLPTVEEFEAELSKEADDSDTTDSTGRDQGVRK